MRKSLQIMPLLFLFLSFLLPIPAAWAQENHSPLAYLIKMRNAHRTLNYEQLYMIQEDENVRTLRYRHAYANNKEYAQLLRLENRREEMILRDETVSYFGEFQPFSLPSPHILDDLPSVIYADFSRLKGYHFVDAGRERVADRLARVIRLMPNDEFRYQYELWIDEEDFLLLRADLFDRNRQLLEQFKVVQSTVDDHFSYIVEPINSLILPTLIQSKTISSPDTLKWQPSWVPVGFDRLASSTQNLPEMLLDESEQVESQMYSDGLSSFTIYVVQNRGLIFEDQYWREGKTSIYSQTMGDKDIIVIGEIPLVSARHIVQQMQYLH